MTSTRQARQTDGADRYRQMDEVDSHTTWHFRHFSAALVSSCLQRQGALSGARRSAGMQCQACWASRRRRERYQPWAAGSVLGAASEHTKRGVTGGGGRRGTGERHAKKGEIGEGGTENKRKTISKRHLHTTKTLQQAQEEEKKTKKAHRLSNRNTNITSYIKGNRASPSNRQHSQNTLVCF